MSWQRSARLGERRIHPALPLPLDRLGVDVVEEQVDGHPDGSAEGIPPEEAVERVRRADPDEVGLQIVEDSVDRLEALRGEPHGAAFADMCLESQRLA